MRPAPRRVGNSFGQLFPQLFLIPLLLVTVGVLIYLFFVASASDHRSVEQILRDMLAGGEHSRKQDAYALAQRVMLDVSGDPKAGSGANAPPKYFSASETNLLISLLEKHPDDESMRPFVIKTLGWVGQPALALPALLKLQDTAAARPSNEQLAVIQSLGFTRSKEVVAPLLGILEKSQGNWRTSLSTIIALVQVTKYRDDVDKLAIAAKLRPFLANEQREVSWNTAYFLAEYFDDASGIGILRNLLDPVELDRQKGDQQRSFSEREKQSWMLFSLKALWKLEPGEIRPRLEELKAIGQERRWSEFLNEVLILIGDEKSAQTDGSAAASESRGEE